ncbi:hypothetical protein DFH06DRAFT_1259918, partial [Mycena polygramma]
MSILALLGIFAPQCCSNRPLRRPVPVDTKQSDPRFDVTGSIKDIFDQSAQYLGAELEGFGVPIRLRRRGFTL